VEASRKHGPFDMRWHAGKNGSPGVPEAPPLKAEELAEGLDWDGFSDRFFRGRRRHNSEARSAYAAYSQGREWRTPARLHLVRSERASDAEKQERVEAGTRRLMAAMAATQARDGQSGLPRDDT
jgi:hypothetical protein